MPEKLKKPFKPDCPMNLKLAEGHLIRKGHKLRAHWEKDKEGDFFQVLVRECCKD